MGVPVVLCRRLETNSSMCRLSCPSSLLSSRPLTFKFFVVWAVVEQIFKVFLPGQSPTARGWLGGGSLQGFPTGQGSTADQDEPLTWYDEELDQEWCRFEDHHGRSCWHLLTTDHSQWELPWLSRAVGKQIVVCQRHSSCASWR